MVLLGIIQPTTTPKVVWDLDIAYWNQGGTDGSYSECRSTVSRQSKKDALGRAELGDCVGTTSEFPAAGCEWVL